MLKYFSPPLVDYMTCTLAAAWARLFQMMKYIAMGCRRCRLYVFMRSLFAVWHGLLCAPLFLGGGGLGGQGSKRKERKRERESITKNGQKLNLIRNTRTQTAQRDLCRSPFTNNNQGEAPLIPPQGDSPISGQQVTRSERCKCVRDSCVLPKDTSAAQGAWGPVTWREVEVGETQLVHSVVTWRALLCALPPFSGNLIYKSDPAC